MTREELWSEYVRRNPSFDCGWHVTLSAAGLRKMFDLTWNTAEEHGLEMGRSSARSTDGVPELFKEVFTKKR